MFRFVVLGLLRRGDTHHGYALVKLYRERSGLKVSSGSFYRELQRLVNDGLVQGVTGDRQGDERRAPYRITLLGEAAFDNWLHEAIGRSHHGCEDEITSRSLFVGEADTNTVNRALAGWQDGLWLETKLLERHREKALSRPAPQSGILDTLSLLIARRLKHVAADLEFVEEFRAAYLACQSNSKKAQESPALAAPKTRRKLGRSDQAAGSK